jgi:hypothetical protein
MGLTEHEREGDNEELIALIVTDMQDPVTPIIEATLAGEGLHDAGRVIARLNKVIHQGAAMIDENLLRVGAVEVDLGHIQPPSNGRVAASLQRCCCPRRRGTEAGSGDALKI